VCEHDQYYRKALFLILIVAKERNFEQVPRRLSEKDFYSVDELCSSKPQ
jgi:hypothetical protein